MISALIRVEHGPGALAVTLASLVPGVLDGLIAEAIVLVPESDPVIAQVADAVGARLSIVGSEPSPWSAGAALARREWLLCLDDGDMPGDEWVHALERFIGTAQAAGGFGRMPRKAASFGEQLARGLRALRRPVLVQSGDLVHRRLLAQGVAKSAPARIPVLIERRAALR